MRYLSGTLGSGALFWALLSWTPATAQEVVPADTEQLVEGPAVVMDEQVYRRYVRDSRQLGACMAGLDDLAAEVVAGHRRVLTVRELLDEEATDCEVVTRQQAADLAGATSAIELAERRRMRVRGQRDALLVVVAVVVVLVAVK